MPIRAQRNVQPRGRQNYYEADQRRSTINANPRQQLIRASQIDAISDEVEEVITIKKDNFAPKNDQRIATFVKIAAVISIVVIAALALTSIWGGMGLAIGAGVTAVALGLVLAGVSKYLNIVAKERKDAEEDVDDVHKAAIRHLVAEVVDEHDNEVEMTQYPQYRGRRAPQARQPRIPQAYFRPAQAPAYVPAAPAGNLDMADFGF